MLKLSLLCSLWEGFPIPISMVLWEGFSTPIAELLDRGWKPLPQRQGKPEYGVSLRFCFNRII